MRIQRLISSILHPGSFGMCDSYLYLHGLIDALRDSASSEVEAPQAATLKELLGTMSHNEALRA